MTRILGTAFALLALAFVSSSGAVEAAPMPAVNLTWCQDASANHFTVQWDDVRVTDGMLVGYSSPGNVTFSAPFSIKGTRHGQATVNVALGVTGPTSVDVNLMAGRKLTTETIPLPATAPACGS